MPALRSDAVHDHLRERILDGRLAPGDALPSERALSDELAVNRHAVREAVKRLQQAGLVRVSQGGATRVLDWRRTAGLDLLAELARRSGTPELVGAVLEMRATIGVDAARRCAERAGAQLRAQLRGWRPADLERYEELWALIVDGAANVAYRLAFNSLVAARHGGGVDPALYEVEWRDGAAAVALAHAVADGDPFEAAARAGDLLERPR